MFACPHLSRLCAALLPNVITTSPTFYICNAGATCPTGVAYSQYLDLVWESLLTKILTQPITIQFVASSTPYTLSPGIPYLYFQSYAFAHMVTVAGSQTDVTQVTLASISGINTDFIRVINCRMTIYGLTISGTAVGPYSEGLSLYQGAEVYVYGAGLKFSGWSGTNGGNLQLEGSSRFISFAPITMVNAQSGLGLFDNSYAQLFTFSFTGVTVLGVQTCLMHSSIAGNHNGAAVYLYGGSTVNINPLNSGPACICAVTYDFQCASGGERVQGISNAHYADAQCSCSSATHPQCTATFG